jgi:hypothetical protein
VSCMHWCLANIVGHALCRVFDITPVAYRLLVLLFVTPYAIAVWCNMIIS